MPASDQLPEDSSEQEIYLGYILPLKFRDAFDMEKALRDLGVPTDMWGEGRSKTIFDLDRELRLGEAKLFFDTSTQRVTREISPVLVNIYHDAKDGSGRLALVELSRSGGRSFWRRRKHFRKHKNVSLSEKKLPDETPVQAVVRALAEELRITDLTAKEKEGIIQESGDYHREEPIVTQGWEGLDRELQLDLIDAILNTTTSGMYRPEPYAKPGGSASVSYPGSFTRYLRHFFLYVIPDRHFKLRYVEWTSDGGVVVFGWRPTGSSLKAKIGFWMYCLKWMLKSAIERFKSLII